MAKSKRHRPERRLTFIQMFSKVRRDDHRPTRAMADKRLRRERDRVRRDIDRDRYEDG